jgi:hypothetical protein
VAVILARGSTSTRLGPTCLRAMTAPRRTAPRTRALALRTGVAIGLGLALALLAAATSAAQCVSPYFVYPATLPTPGQGPRDLVFADFDRDGYLDLATADFDDDTVTVNWGKDLGGWEATPTVVGLGANTGPVALAAGDLDGNGTPDLLVALYGSQQLVPLLKGTTGRDFSVGNTVSVANAPLDVGLGDFERDGDLDAVSAGETGLTQFSFNDGLGVLTNGVSVTPLPVGSPVNALGVADFNRDGYLDVALARGATKDVVLLLDDHAGGYTQQPFPAPNGEPEDVALGDVNRDGAVDVVLAVQNANEVNVLLGDGGGGFSGSELFDVAGPQGGVALGDFTRDGILDVVTSAGFAYVTGVGDGTGKFGSPDIWGGDPVHVAVGDIESDGDLDLGGVNPGGTLSLQYAVTSQTCPQSSFARAGRLQPVPNGATAMVSGDWNGDGIPDLATAGTVALSILTSDGRLGFSSAVDLGLAASGSPKSITVADFDLDGDPDLAVTTQTLEVLLYKNTAGVFSGAGTVPHPGWAAYAVTSGDFNGDGAPDLVVLSRLGASLTFYAGGGDLGFGPAVLTVIGLGSLSAIAPGDIDGDGHLDVVVASDSNNLVRWYKGDGAGGFALGGAGDYPVGAFPGSVAVGDLNGDFRPDVAVSNTLSDDVTILLNAGGGTFLPPTFFAAGDAPFSVVVGNANGDGRPDLVVANRDTNDVTVLLGDGSGGFPTSRRVPGANAPNVALLFDADRNGNADLAVANWPSSTGGSVHVLPGEGLGDFGPVQVPGGSSGPVAAADFDRDGRPDLVTGDPGNPEILFHRGKGDGTFEAPISSPAVAVVTSLGVGDFDRDGVPDVVASTGAAVAVMLGDGAGTFASQPAFFPLPDTGGLAVADFDHDGKLDVAKSDTTPGTLTVLFGDGAGGFAATTFTTAVGGYPSAIVALDFNRDGILDLAVANATSDNVSILAGTGTRSFFVSTTLATGPFSFPTGLAAGDFDKDGITDLVVTPQSDAPARIGYFRGTGLGFAAEATYPLGDPNKLNASSVATGDFNGDGSLDLLVACRSDGNRDRYSVRVLPGTGMPAAAFGPAEVWSIAQAMPSSIAVADFDRNGKPDFVTRGLSFSPTATDTRPVVLNSSCQPRRLFVARDVSLCNTPLTPFGTQPAIRIEDDGANPIQCDAQPVMASIVPGTGTVGASLGGSPSLTPTNGVSDWATTLPGLSIDTPGVKYRLGFQHPDAGFTFSRTFSLAPALAITGPSEYCAAQAGLFSTDAGLDTYRWYVDSMGPAGFASSYTIPAGTLGVGGHGIEVQATVDTCPVNANQPFNLVGDLTGVVVTPGTPVSVCGNCTGPMLTVAETGGGILTRRWGYRMTSGVGTPTWIPGQTGSSYGLNGSDFPGQGTYYLVEETTPQCGIATESNEIQVDVSTTATPADLVPALTVRSTSTVNRLEWVFPPGLNKVAIRYRTSPDWATCVPPETSADGFSDIADQAGTAGSKLAFPHTALTDGLTYCYTIFAENPLGSGSYSLNGRSVKGRPFDTSGAVKWAFSMGTAAMSAPGLGSGILHAVSNDDFLHAMVKAGLVGAGAWPISWKPYLGTGPSQSRPANVPYSPSPPYAVVYLGAQAAVGNNAVGVDADTGLGLWGQALGQPVQAGPAGIFMVYGGAIDAILLGTRDGSGPNAFHALDPFTLNPLPSPWPYTGDTSPFTNPIGIVSSQAAVDYAASRVYFTSYQYTPGSTDSVWCVDLLSADRCVGWAAGVTAGLGNVAASPTLRGSRVYVSPIVGVDGEIEALDASDGTKAWSASFAPGDGQIKQFILADLFGTDLYFSTTNTVWAITDGGSAWAPKWQRADIPSPSQPVFYAGTGRVYVGGGDGKLYVLDATDGSDVVPPIALGDPGLSAGAPTVDQAGGFVYLGSDAGVVFAVAIP